MTPSLKNAVFLSRDQALPSLNDLYENYSDTAVFVQDLEVRGVQLIKQALADKSVKVYKGSARRKTAKQKWFKHMTYGQESPHIVDIELSNGCIIRNYSRFDNREEVKENEALELINGPLTEYGFPHTISGIIRKYVPQREVKFQDYCLFINAFKGGASYIQPEFLGRVIDREIHLDYHQMYSSILKNCLFPHDTVIVNGFFPGEYNIYTLKGGEVKLKPDGYNLLFAKADMTQWRSVGHKQFTDVDFRLLLNNYEVRNLDFDYTIRGVEVAKEDSIIELIDDIYKKRKEATNPAVQQFYKLLNENIAGNYERNYFKSGWWEDLTGPDNTDISKTKYYDNLVGIWITSYGRDRLYRVLKLLDKDKVIGWDTDAVFFNGGPEDVPESVNKMMGSEMGQIHIDTNLINSYHVAIKQYWGIDYETGEIVGKIAGVPQARGVVEDLCFKKVPVVEIQAWDPQEQEFTYCLDTAKIPKEQLKKILEREEPYE